MMWVMVTRVILKGLAKGVKGGMGEVYFDLVL